MSLPSQIDVESLCQIYLVSNTPRYLYKHLRSDPSVQWMAKNLSANQLVGLYTESQEGSTRSISEVAVAHAVLAALSHMSYGDIAPVLDSLPTAGLKWASELIDILKRTRIIIETVSFEVPRKNLLPWENIPSRTSTASIVLSRNR